MSYFKRRKIASKVEIERPEFVQGHFMHRESVGAAMRPVVFRGG